MRPRLIGFSLLCLVMAPGVRLSAANDPGLQLQVTGQGMGKLTDGTAVLVLDVDLIAPANGVDVLVNQDNIVLSAQGKQIRRQNVISLRHRERRW